MIRNLTPLLRASSRAMASSSQGLPLFQLPIGSRGFSCSALGAAMGLERLIRPEVFPAPSAAVPTTRCAAAVAKSSRSLSTASQPGFVLPPPTTVIRPPDTKIILPHGPEGLHLPYSPTLWGAKEPIQKGPKLPVLTQLSFYDPEDVKLTSWENPVPYLKRTPAVATVNHPLIGDHDGKPLMLQFDGQKLWRSGIKLVSRNRQRGYCIARALVEENMEVSTLHGTFRIKEPIYDEISGKDKSEFLGFKQLKKLFENLMKQAYGDNVISDLSLDVPHLLAVLDVAALHEILAVYHAALLAPEGRARLSIRLASIFREDIIESEGVSAKSKIQAIYEDLGYLGIGINAMHPFFEELHEYSTDVKNKMSHGKQQQEVAELTFDDQEHIDRIAAGYWLVTINRNGVTHCFSKKLAAFTKGAKYTRTDVTELLHYKMPKYLPVAQAICRSKRYWKWLDMGSCFPEETVYEE
ncbi:unnamed protein product [Urochloa humidicola]